MSQMQAPIPVTDPNDIDDNGNDISPYDDDNDNDNDNLTESFQSSCNYLNYYDFTPLKHPKNVLKFSQKSGDNCEMPGTFGSGIGFNSQSNTMQTTGYISGETCSKTSSVTKWNTRS